MGNVLVSYKNSIGISTRSNQVSLVGANNLFGSIGRNSFFPSTTYGFLPTNGNGGTIDLTGDRVDVDARWLGLENKQMQYWAYNYCSPLAAVIDRLAEADTNGKVKFVDSEENVIKKPNKIPRLARVKKLLNKPNFLQTWEEFNSEQVVICKIFGYCPVFAIGPAGMDKTYSKALVNLNPYFCTPRINPNFDLLGNQTDEKGEWDGIDRESPILEWQLSIFGKSYTIPASDILLIKDGYINSPTPQNGLPISKVAGLDYFVSNICAAMEADNVLLKKKGPLGIFSHETKPDIAGVIPMTGTAKDELQEDLKRYGLTTGQLQYIISKYPVRWNPMSFNLRDLMTKETVRQGIDGICDRLGYPAELMSGKNATYENRSSAEKYMYQTTIITFSLRRTAKYNEFFELDDDKLYIDYNHLPVLQEDILKAGEARFAMSQSVQVDWEGGRLTWNECRVLQEMDRVEGMDLYFNEYMKKYPAPAPPVKTVKKIKSAA